MENETVSTPFQIARIIANLVSLFTNNIATECLNYIGRCHISFSFIDITTQVPHLLLQKLCSSRFFPIVTIMTHTCRFIMTKRRQSRGKIAH